ncbi:MAG: EAL domain-containing protein, partial [Pseudomonadota bacterium]
ANLARLSGQVSALHQLGIRTVIDDFATSYGALADGLEIDAVKINRRVVSSMFDNRGSMAMIKATMALAANLDLGVVAKGVETERQANFFADGLTQQQGFYFGRPMEAHNLTATWQPNILATA